MLAVAPLFIAMLQVVSTAPRDTTASTDTTTATVAVASMATALDSVRLVRFDDDTVKRRPRPVEYSEWYARRLTIHRIGSYTMLPIFAYQYYLGQQLIDHGSTGSNKDLHAAAGMAIGGLFTINTVTGLWNLWDSRQDPAGRTRRFIHTALMLASDAGFVWTGAIGGDAEHSSSNARYHRNVAIGSMAIASVGTAMMWLWKN